jgi:hypothetical protein
MDMKTINFIKKNYSKRTNELGKSLNATNSVLENFLEDLNKETAKLQSNKEFGKVIDVINTQQKIFELMENHSKIIDSLRVEKETIQKTNAEDVDYGQFEVDTTKPYNLNMDFRHKRPHAISINDDFIEISTWKEMLVKTAEYLYNLNPELFNTFLTEKSLMWGDKVNFTKDPKKLREAARIEGSDIYVEISKDSIAVRQLVIKMLEIFNIDTSNYKVYLRADYTPLHDPKDLQVAKR